MAKLSKGNILRIGQVAEICNVSPRTVSKWFDTGQLRGYRIPGSKDRRISVDQLVRFMRAHGIVSEEFQRRFGKRVLFIDSSSDWEYFSSLKRNGYEVRGAKSAFEAGFLFSEWHPSYVVLNINLLKVDLGDLHSFRKKYKYEGFEETRWFVFGHVNLTEEQIQEAEEKDFFCCPGIGYSAFVDALRSAEAEE